MNEWEPGTEGKGFLTDKGLWTWNISGPDRRPWHMHKSKLIKARGERVLSSFYISEDGQVGSFKGISDENLERIKELDPRFYTPEIDEFRFASQSWQPGQNGKGFLFSDGIESWSCSSAWTPDHGDMKELTEGRNLTGYLHIYPTGKFELYTGPETSDEEARLLAHQYDQRLDLGEEEWAFGEV